MALHIQQIACGRYHSLALLSDGSVWATGYNWAGQLGDGTNKTKTMWSCVIPSGSDVVKIAAGSEYSLALKSGGSLWATGHNRYGQLGDSMSKYNQLTWISLISAGVTQVAAGRGYSLVLKSDGSLWATGYNGHGQLGDETEETKKRWMPVIPSGSDVVQLAAGDDHSFALKSGGSVRATGRNDLGQLGDGMTAYKTTWTSVIPSGVTQVAAGGYHSLALKSDGSVWATGFNYDGQLGDGATTKKSTWASVISSGVTQVAAGNYHSLALKSDGSVWAAGNNGEDQLGNGSGQSNKTWFPVISSGVIQLSAGVNHSFVLKLDGTLCKTGSNNCGQLGFEGDHSTVWIPDRFFEKLLLESLLIDPPRSRRTLNETGEASDAITESADDWHRLSL